MRKPKNRPLKLAYGIVLFFSILAFISPWLATDQPLYAKYQGKNIFPAFSKGKMEIKNEQGLQENFAYKSVDWKKIKLEKALWALVTYEAGKSDPNNFDFVSPMEKQFFATSEDSLIEMPLKFRHWLGTGRRGDDVLAGIIHGARVSLEVGFFSVLIAALLGILTGAAAGYYSNSGLKIKLGKAISLIPGFFLAFFYAFYLKIYPIKGILESTISEFFLQILLSICIASVIVILFLKVGSLLEHFKIFTKEISLPVDSFFSRIIEVLISTPRLLLILSFAAIVTPSLTTVIFIIGFTSWTGIARLVRAEFIKVKNMEYILWCQSSGYSTGRIIFFQALPNVIKSVWPVFIFNIAAAILLESSLSFLGIGIPPDMITWGSLISNGHDNINAWWLITFPGLAIFLLIFSLYTITQQMEKIQK